MIPSFVAPRQLRLPILSRNWGDFLFSGGCVTEYRGHVTWRLGALNVGAGRISDRSAALGRGGDGGLPVGVEGEDPVEIGDLENALQLLAEGTDRHLALLGLELGPGFQQQP